MLPRFPAGEMPSIPAARGGIGGRGNAAPLPESRVFVVEKGKTLAVPAPGLLPPAPRTEETPATRTVAMDTAPAHGKVTVKPDGSFTYAAEKGFTGTDTFTFHIAGGATPLPGTVTVVVR